MLHLYACEPQAYTGQSGVWPERVMTNRMSSNFSCANSSCLRPLSGNANSHSPNGDLSIMAVQLVALPLRVLITPSIEAAASPPSPALPPHEVQSTHLNFRFRVAHACEVGDHMLDPEVIKIRREVLAHRGEAYCPLGACLARVVQVVQLVRKLAAEAHDQ